MEQLPEALLALAKYRQFILWKAVWNGPKGKWDKCPVDHRTLSVFVKGGGWQQDPDAWTDSDTALKLAKASNGALHVGFFFTPSDPFYFLDIDKCLQADNTWTPLARQLCARLKGAAVEVSYSGKGLHIFGTGPVPLEHGCRDGLNNLELYTSGRFVALTGTNAMGDAGHDSGAAITSISVEHFPARAVVVSDEWTTEPVDEWSGPTDDDELIELMMNAKSSTAAVMGQKATLKQLWEADDSILSELYPPDNDYDTFNHSFADGALCAHLAFYTGKDCERIQRIFERSALIREKWEDREYYRSRTIRGACGVTTQVYGQPRPEPESAVAVAPVQAAVVAEAEVVGEGMAAAIREGWQCLFLTQQQDYFKGCVYVIEAHKVFVPNGSMLKPDQFKATYGGYVFAMDAENKVTSKSAWETFTESKAITFPKADSTCFRPDLEPGTIIYKEGRSYVNIYVPITTSLNLSHDLILKALPRLVSAI